MSRQMRAMSKSRWTVMMAIINPRHRHWHGYASTAGSGRCRQYQAHVLSRGRLTQQRVLWLWNCSGGGHCLALGLALLTLVQRQSSSTPAILTYIPQYLQLSSDLTTLTTTQTLLPRLCALALPFQNGHELQSIATTTPFSTTKVIARWGGPRCGRTFADFVHSFSW